VPLSAWPSDGPGGAAEGRRGHEYGQDLGERVPQQEAGAGTDRLEDGDLRAPLDQTAAAPWLASAGGPRAPILEAVYGACVIDPATGA
jgi:hypothetical protein